MKCVSQIFNDGLVLVWVMVFNATFNDISITSWMSPCIQDSHHTNVNTMHTTLLTLKLLISINEAYN
jgi:hypothetical protein